MQSSVGHEHLLPDPTPCSRYSHHARALCPSQPLQDTSEGTTFLADHRIQHWPPHHSRIPFPPFYVYYTCHNLRASSGPLHPYYAKMSALGKQGLVRFHYSMHGYLVQGPGYWKHPVNKCPPKPPSQVPSWCLHSSFMTYIQGPSPQGQTFHDKL